MYKTRIKSWGLDKNFKESEVVELFRLRRERERVGKMKSTYMIRGREVDWDRVQSYIRRKGINISQLLNTTPVGSSAREVSCVTPPPTLPGTGTIQPGSSNLVRVSSPSSSSEAPSPSQGFTTPSSAGLLLTPISPIPTTGLGLGTAAPSPRRLSHPVPLQVPNPAFVSNTTTFGPYQSSPSISLPPSSRSGPASSSTAPTNSTIPTLREFQSLLTALYQNTMFQDGDKTWGTTEYWLRNTRSLEWFSVIRYKLALMPPQKQTKAASRSGSWNWKNFCTYNRAFASIEGTSRNVIGTRTWYIINYFCWFWDSGEDVGQRATVEKVLGEVMRVCGYTFLSGQSAKGGKNRNSEQMNHCGSSSSSRGGASRSFIDDKVGFRESAERFLKAIMERMVSQIGLSTNKKGMLEGVLMLEEDGDGYPVLADKKEEGGGEWKGTEGRKRMMSVGSKESRWSTTCLISSTATAVNDDTTEGQGLVGMLELGVKLLAQREEAKAEERLRNVVEGGSFRGQASTTPGMNEEEKVLARCASYHLSRIYRRRGQVELARECLMKAVEGSLYFDKFVSWDEAGFLFA
ncbi:hypothetical protein QBC43DRAFT_204768 [Cladorrhinum sp. PSN259]|nr:hypothetical protein QBC43DRAFT_204768 [Cladorrhinum sp. PSN259]